MTFRRNFLAASVAILAATAGLQAQAQTVLKATDTHPAGYPTVVAVENMGKKLEAQTSGRYKVQMFPGAVLGQEKETVEQTQIGALQLNRISLGVVGPVVPDVDVFNMPFVFRDINHMRKVIDGPIGDELLAKVTASPARLVALGWMDGGARSLYTKKLVKTPADLKGVKVRMMGNPLFVDTMNAMGGNGISMAYGEVFSALQTGVIDGAENNPPSMFTSNHFSTGTKYYAQTNHLIIPELLVMSKVAWDKLTPADQALVKKLGREAQLEQRALWDKSVEEHTAKLKAAGVEFVPVDQKLFFDATEPVRAKYGAKFTDLMKRIAEVKYVGSLCSRYLGAPHAAPLCKTTGKPMKQLTHRFCDWLYLACIWIAGISIFVMSLIIPWGIFTRYVLGTGSQWPEPIATLLMVVFTFLGAAAGYRANGHIAVAMVTERLPTAVQPVLARAMDVLMLFIAIFMTWYGAKLCMETWNQSIGQLPWMPVGVTYLPVPIGGAITALFVLERLVYGYQHHRDVVTYDHEKVTEPEAT